MHRRSRAGLPATMLVFVQADRLRQASAGAFPGDDGPRRGEQDLEVGPERIRSRIAQVEPHHVVEGGAASALHLPQPGNAGLRLENPPAVPRLVLLELIW